LRKNGPWRKEGGEIREGVGQGVRGGTHVGVLVVPLISTFKSAGERGQWGFGKTVPRYRVAVKALFLLVNMALSCDDFRIRLIFR
jgi:hypothetical protein